MGSSGSLSGDFQVSRGGWSVEWGFLRSAGGSGGLSGGRRGSWWSEWWRPQVSRGGWRVECGFLRSAGVLVV